MTKALGGAVLAALVIGFVARPFVTPPATAAEAITSDRAQKQDFAPVDGDEVLKKLADLRVESWSYRNDPAVRHIGPMAQDFRATFNVGKDDKSIAQVDANGVTIAALQALHRRVQALEEENRRLRGSSRPSSAPPRVASPARASAAAPTTWGAVTHDKGEVF